MIEVLLRSLYGVTAVMAVPRRSHCGLAQSAVALNMFKASSVAPRRSAVLTVVRDQWRSMAEPLRNHGDHGGATAGYAVQAP